MTIQRLFEGKATHENVAPKLPHVPPPKKRAPLASKRIKRKTTSNDAPCINTLKEQNDQIARDHTLEGQNRDALSPTSPNLPQMATNLAAKESESDQQRLGVTLLTFDDWENEDTDIKVVTLSSTLASVTSS